MPFLVRVYVRKRVLQYLAMSDLKFWLALNRVPGLGTQRFRLLLARYPSLEEAWRASASDLEAAGLDRRTVTAVLECRARISPDEEQEKLALAGVSAFTLRDAAYPPRLKETYDPPPVLYVRGALLPVDERSVAVVGTRKATAYGREAAFTLAGDLARHNVTIVSGLARGIDAVAHRAALEAGGRTIAVLANGLDIVYPPEHRGLSADVEAHGALLSEHQLGTRPDASHFPRRNRILSGMTLGTLVVEAGEVSGALWTVSHALEQDREVFCVPGSIFSPASVGANRLIQEGAKLVMSYVDILEELNLTSVARQLEMPAIVVPASDAESALLGQLSHEPVHIDDIQRRTGLPISTVSGTLALMELKGQARQVGGMHYIRTREAAAHYGG